MNPCLKRGQFLGPTSPPRASNLLYSSCRSLSPTVSDAAHRSGKLGPIEAECFADLANRTRVELMVRAD